MKLVKYSATWCGPCKQFAPIAKRVTAEMGVELEEVDVTGSPVEGVQSVPTIRLYSESGELLGEHSGALAPLALKKWLTEHSEA